MINSLDIVTIKAILVALAQQSSPLRSDIQKQLNELGENLIENLNELDDLFLADPDLAEPYDVVIEKLAPSGERNKGLNVPPKPPSEGENPEDLLIKNLSRLRLVNNDELCKMTTKALEADDSVKIAQENLLRCLSSL